MFRACNLLQDNETNFMREKLAVSILRLLRTARTHNARYFRRSGEIRQVFDAGKREVLLSCVNVE